MIDQKNKANEDTSKDNKAAMSKGEKIFNWSVYSGLNYWVNLAASLAIADFFINRGGKKPLAAAVGKVASSLMKMGVGEKRAYHNSKTIVETLTLMSGGWLLVVPMKILEDNKRKVVHWINEKKGVDQTAPDGHHMTADEIHIVDEQPPQTWWNALKRRLIATAAVLSVGQAIEHGFMDRKTNETHSFALDPYNPSSKIITYDTHPGGKDYISRLATKGIGFVSKKIGTKAFTDKKAVHNIIELGALDTAFTKITALVMKLTNGTKKQKMPHEIGDDSSAPVVEAMPAPAPVQDEPQKIFADESLKRNQAKTQRNNLEDGFAASLANRSHESVQIGA